ncbi:DNA mismatch repair protein MutS [Oceanibaculum pacificum]|uniref:DNA mismatch repair protein MutS n=1 Tax=Oceanibaculum pacificum TaxID=580166 RepID=A0A154WHD4_9PROT|nr:DNA mismatch repair protein MutS [Oceanibaculum pacificum]KZD12927.1 DNA mismatch repair protein MutS [Oceanibaculum pacificum]
MLAHYIETKRAHPDCLLFYRMGDFYELFLEDAVTAAAALDITLTKRGQHAGEDVPMCGVPVHAYDAYLSRLVRQGHKVAICEQVEDPAEAKKRGGKSLVKREVVRIVTPGTVTEDALLDARRHNHLVCLADAQGRLGLAWVDMSTGEFSVQPIAEAGLAAALARLDPQELLLPDRLLQREALFEAFADWKSVMTPQPGARFDSVAGEKRLMALFEVQALDAFGAFERAELAAAGALVDYVELTQKGKLPRLSAPRRLQAGAVMEIDAATRRSLELTRTQTGERKGSLLSVIDRTVTGAGARLLAAWLAAPLTDVPAIEDRLDRVQFFLDQEALRGKTRETLKRCPDIERALTRLTLDRGGPRDLAAIRDALTETSTLRELIARPSLMPLPAGIAQALDDLGRHNALVDRLTRALAAELPVLTRDGGFIAPGYAPELDHLRSLRDESRRLIAGLQARYQQESGVSALKIKHNNVLGYFIEVSTNHGDKLLRQENFIHRQTMASAVRFTTVELGELEQKLSSAADKALAVELALFKDLVGEVTLRADAVALAANAIARIDVAAALAELAVDCRYARPEMASDTAFAIQGGRHPVVEAALQAAGARFVGNDCVLEAEKRLWLLTGPNMAGKSTFLRQNALIAILAQIGSFVPADKARIGAVDRLFSRVGAADDLARGRSTFMVEMVETAAILNQASERSLVILDEIGRGTATYDGLSIAWATVEHLHAVNRCRTLFATHYHELTQLSEKLDHLACHTMRVKEWQDDIVFLHEVAAGAADRSYGIHVAKLAGLPAPVIARAEAVLKRLEEGETGARPGSSPARIADDLPLFAAMAPKPPAASPAGPSPAEAALAEINPDELTPRGALDALYRLKGLLE